MSLSESLSRALLLVPSSYNDIRPHHAFLGYLLYASIAQSKLVQTIQKKIYQYLSQLTEKAIPLIYTGLIPDVLVRFGIRLQLQDHLYILEGENVEQDLETKLKIIESLQNMPIAIKTDEANTQHYEVPASFYELCLGPRRKYSSGYWKTGYALDKFEQSELDMLDLYCKRANVKDGMDIVDLGCGWGSLTLYLAEHYKVHVTGISNSNSQREYIYQQAEKRGIRDRVTIVTCNVADDKGALDVVKNKDLVMTIEMFEHMKNYDVLLNKIHGFLKPKGQLFVHIFTHRHFCYHFEEGWMSENFFTGGTMPSDDLLLYFLKGRFGIEKHWRVNGSHYEKTSNAWLATLDQNWKNGKLKPVLNEAYGADKEKEWYVNWRLFFMACAELWGYKGGQEWIVSHYLFQKE